jgi:hypothetical protein
VMGCFRRSPTRHHDHTLGFFWVSAVKL